MPYIADHETRAELMRLVAEAIETSDAAESVGTFTYFLTMACVEYLAYSELKFQRLAEVVAALECTKLELYRRIVVPYEDRARRKHGDVKHIRTLLMRMREEL